MNRLAKRLKRHLIGPVREFFAITAPGLETLCHDELLSLPLSVEKVVPAAGGVAFRGRLTDCYQANLHLRTANRILMRIGQFRASDFKTLKKKAEKIPWELYLPRQSTSKLKVTSHQSRLYHSQAIAQRIGAVIDSRMARFEPGAAGNLKRQLRQTVYARAVNDRFTLSVDTSGEALYKRGVKRHGGQAPVRETLAAALLMQMGYAGDRMLLDPMCGSGTFTLEAVLMTLNIPPGWYRDFVFTRWPAFRPKTWAHIRNQAQKRIIAGHGGSIRAMDLDGDACKRLGDCLRAMGFSESVGISRRDFFDIDPARITDRPGYVVLNPPYGRRMGKPGETDELQSAVLTKLGTDYRGWRLGLIMPAGRAGSLVPFGLDSLTVLHGGLRIKLITGTIP